MPTDVRSLGGAALLQAPDPTRTVEGEVVGPYMVTPGMGDPLSPAPFPDGLVSMWTTRWMQWRNAFEQQQGPKIRRYWPLWRNFQTTGNPGPGQDWRDRTVIPQAFKEVVTRMPRLILGLWATPERFTVRGRGMRDEEYEEQVRVLMETMLEEVGNNDPIGTSFLMRMIEAGLYCQIMGHVWYKPFWRTQRQWIKTKMPVDVDPETQKVKKWRNVEFANTTFDGLDVSWLPMSDVAIDVHGRRRWSIELIRTSLESLKLEDELYFKETKQHLYENLDELERDGGGTPTRESTQEPRDTEHWPLDDGLIQRDPLETPVEMWLCWDNVLGTCTKIANRRVRLAHGYMDTPDSFDPYVDDRAVRIPGSPYGDSMFNWTESLHIRQTRIARNRMDEMLMNLFQQYIVRENFLNSTTQFWRPGGMLIGRGASQERPIADNIYLVPRRPLPPEGYQEESYTQRMSEATAGADSTMQGVEATSKSRDVTAAEVNQRVLQGANRYQLEMLEHANSAKLLLKKCYLLIQQNLTEPRMIRILDDVEGKPLDLRNLDRDVDIVVGTGLDEGTLQERMQEIERLTTYVMQPMVAPVVKFPELTLALFKSTKSFRKDAAKYVKTPEEIAKEQAAAMAAAGMAQGGAAPGPGGAEEPGGSSGPEAAGGGPSGLAGPTGSAGPPPGGSSEEI